MTETYASDDAASVQKEVKDFLKLKQEIKDLEKRLDEGAVDWARTATRNALNQLLDRKVETAIHAEDWEKLCKLKKQLDERVQWAEDHKNKKNELKRLTDVFLRL